MDRDRLRHRDTGIRGEIRIDGLIVSIMVDDPVDWQRRALLPQPLRSVTTVRSSQ